MLLSQMYSRMVLTVVCWRYGMSSDADANEIVAYLRQRMSPSMQKF